MPNRKQFIESQGATCSNWTWSWSFFDHASNRIIFGLWNDRIEGERGLILSKDWERGGTGRKNPGYKHALRDLRRVTEQGYRLFTFPMTPVETADGRVTIGAFEPALTERGLTYIAGHWYATPLYHAADVPDNGAAYLVEGALTTITVNAYERNFLARAECIEHFGAVCRCCGFNFEDVYGELGAGYIHVHHRVPLATIGREYTVDPITDLAPVCPNCHAMIHKTQPPLDVEELRRRLQTTQA